MSDDTLHINVVGGSQAEGELKKVAGGYRAIGKAADQAAHSADKVHGGGHERQRQAVINKTLLGGKGGIGATVGHLQHMGVAAGAAYAAMEGLSIMAERSEAHLERGAKLLEAQADITEKIKKIEERRDTAALASARNMTTFDKGREEHQSTELSKTIKQIEAFEKIKSVQELATRAMDAGKGLSAEKSEYYGPATTGALEDLKPQLKALQIEQYKAAHESRGDRFKESISWAVSPSKWGEFDNVTHADKAQKMRDDYRATAAVTLSAAGIADNRRQTEIFEAMERAGKSLEKAGHSLGRSSASLPVP